MAASGNKTAVFHFVPLLFCFSGVILFLQMGEHLEHAHTTPAPWNRPPGNRLLVFVPEPLNGL